MVFIKFDTPCVSSFVTAFGLPFAGELSFRSQDPANPEDFELLKLLLMPPADSGAMVFIKFDTPCVSLFVTAFGLATALMLADVFQMGPLAGLNFHAEDINLPPPALASNVTDPLQRLTKAELKYVKEAFGSESLAFDATGAGPYASLSDGRVVRRSADDSSWETVAITSPNWNATLCSYTTPEAPRPNLTMEHICGRPLGIRFHPSTGDLYIADAYFGLFVAPKQEGEVEDCGGGSEGGEKTCAAVPPTFGEPELLVDSAEGTKFKFTNDLDIDDSEGKGVVYFTDTSTKYHRRNFLVAIMEGGRHGRLLKLDLNTGQVSVLARGLAFPNGVALSRDKTFFVFCETTLMRCHKYYVRGPKAGSFELLINLPGFPDNIRLNPRGRFWVAVHTRRQTIIDFVLPRKWARTLLLRLLPDIRMVYMLAIGWPHGLIIEVDESGNVTDILEDTRGKVTRAVSEVEEHGGQLWMGSVLMPHIAVLNYTG